METLYAAALLQKPLNFNFPCKIIEQAHSHPLSFSLLLGLSFFLFFRLKFDPRTIFDNMTEYDGSDAGSSHDSDSGYDDSGLQCACGLPAKLRMSQTARNPFRLFYNCPRRYDQCDFFRWCDEPSLTGDRHADELNLIRHECTRLQRRFRKAQQDHEHDRDKWEMEKEELVSTLYKVQAELDEYRRRVKLAAESDLMPPIDPTWNSGKDETDDADGAIEIHMI